jgi:hypothetical protein
VSVVKTLFTVVFVLHGALHLLGVVKAVTPDAVPQLKASIGPASGVLWLAACVALWASAVVLHTAPARFWTVAFAALLLSQTAIVLAWPDARFGTLANLVLAIPVAIALLDLRPSSFSSTYRREVASRLGASETAKLVADADLEALPPLVQTYLRRSRVVGQPRVRNFHMRFHGQLKNGRDGAWMDVSGKQFNSLADRSRIFLVHASMRGLPFEALHVYSNATATMRVRVASLFEVVDAHGPQMNQSETVTLFNDMCLLAPGSLIGARVAWKDVDARTLRATFENGGITISADLTFDDAGDLVGFLSNDRYQSADGKTYQQFPWWTPMSNYKRFGNARIAATGEALWKEPGGDFSYARFVIDDIRYNVGVAPGARSAHDLQSGAGLARGTAEPTQG